jgi:hypothetical protein
MVRAIMIIEIAGRPPKHVKESLEKYVREIDKVKDVELHSIKISEPVEVDGGKDMFTCFAEVDFEVDNFSRLSEIMFDFMPSSVEILEPLKINLNSSDATSLLNNISGRLHRYDEIAKVAHAKIHELNSQLQLAHKIMIEKGIIGEDGKIKNSPTKKKSKKKTTKKTAKKVKKK